MSTVETKAAPYSRLAIVGFLLALGSFAVAFLGRPFAQVLAVVALVLAVVASIRVRRSCGQKKGRELANWGIALASVSGVIFLGLAPAIEHVRDAANRMVSL